ncbi:MAG TPA: SH3 domain-containing protein [Anaerolineales bacterium]|nr:SH3 domain-containing protein [Anaerolineales bacterium]
MGLLSSPAAARQTSDATPTDTEIPNGQYITVTYIEPINVRAGPGSFDYPVLGTIPVGGTAPAIGRSPAGEWIEITFAGGPRDTGWVYAANVTLSSNALLPIVEPPPTATPDVIPTVNPTFVAQLEPSPTGTHLPTFTPAPSLIVPTYTQPADPAIGGSHMGWLIATLAILGLFGLAVSSLRRR